MLTKTLLDLAHINDIPEDGGIAFLLPNKEQIALFKIQNKIYAVQNQCPHKKENVLARGIIGNKENIIYVACPMHKKRFDLKTGKALDHNCGTLKTYPIIIKDDIIYLEWDY
ncbi:MAG: 3-phenylpropionate/cinnamic acid dioxygenase ferredoxin subunit [Leptospiraceae bacterium]|nr:MAG: 3-phenylpropionate/cinnamic acid dioxygenase ferredoxin subunit [Leptospiraceae bacterium]